MTISGRADNAQRSFKCPNCGNMVSIKARVMKCDVCGVLLDAKQNKIVVASDEDY